MRILHSGALIFISASLALSAAVPNQLSRKRSNAPVILSSWDDLLEGVRNNGDWQARKKILRQRYLNLIREEFKPAKPKLDLMIHEEIVVDDVYTRKLISYNVEADERAYAYLGIPLKRDGKLPAIVALHGTYPEGKSRAAGLVDNPDKAYLDHLCRRGYIVIAPEHFVSGHRIPPEGPYETKRFYEKHPEWTAVGKFNYEHSIAIDALESLQEVDAANIGAMGHSLGGHGTFFLAAYDDRIKASASNCGGTFLRHNPLVEAWSRDHWYIYLKPLRPGLLRGELPDIDFHEIMALIAPRAFLDVSGLNDGKKLTQRQRILMNLKLMDVWELEKAPQNFAFFAHGRGHSIKHESRELIYAWMDTHLKPGEATETKRVGHQ